MIEFFISLLKSSYLSIGLGKQRFPISKAKNLEKYN